MLYMHTNNLSSGNVLRFTFFCHHKRKIQIFLKLKRYLLLNEMEDPRIERRHKQTTWGQHMKPGVQLASAH